MPHAGGRSAGKRAPKNGGIGAAVLHHCLRQQAENTQRHQACIQALKEGRAEKKISEPRSPGVALGGAISRHRTLEFLSGNLTTPTSSKGSAGSKHTEQHLRSIIERSGLDDYLSTALAAQETFAVDRHEARLLHESSAPWILPGKPMEERGDGTVLFTEGGDVPIPRRPVFFSKGKAEAWKDIEQRERMSEIMTSRSRRRRNRARVKLLLAGKVEEATVHNVQFVRKQRDELHRRYQKPKDAKSSRRHAKPLGSSSVRRFPGNNERPCADSGSDWDSDVLSQLAAESKAETGSNEGNSSESDGDSDTSLARPSSNAADLETEQERTAIDAQSASIPRLPRTAAELDEVELDSFLRWRRSLASMEDGGIVLTPYERNLEVWRQLWRVVERSHLVLQIVDGRSPGFFRCKDLEKYVREVSPDKRLLLVVNKSDLLPTSVREEWSKYFAANDVNAIFFSALRELNQQSSDVREQTILEAADDSDGGKREVGLEGQNALTAQPEPTTSTVTTASGNSQDIMSCDSLVDLLIQYRDEFIATQTALRTAEESEDPIEDFVVGTVGYPNVGKSSLINALLGSKKVSVSHQPGKTRRLQTIPLKGRGITLCDCPGLVFPKTVGLKHILVLNGVVPVDEMRGDYLPSIQLVCDGIPHTLVQYYGITVDAYREAHKLYRSNVGMGERRLATGNQQETRLDRLEAAPVLLAIAAQRHFVSGGKGGQLDTYRVAKMILRDFTAGRLLRCHVPGGGVFGADAEAIEAERFLSAVRRLTGTGFEVPGCATAAAGTTGIPRRSRVSPSCDNQRQANPVSVLHELEQDLDLLEVVENGEAIKARGQQASYLMTKRKARQMQKQLQKGKGSGAAGFHRL